MNIPPVSKDTAYCSGPFSAASPEYTFVLFDTTSYEAYWSLFEMAADAADPVQASVAFGTLAAASVTITERDGLSSSFTVSRDSEGTEQIEFVSTDGSSINILENAGCSGTNAGVGSNPDDQSQLSWTSAQESSMTMDYNLCYAEEGCTSGMIP